jgi:hypothetical protein
MGWDGRDAFNVEDGWLADGAGDLYLKFVLLGNFSVDFFLKVYIIGLRLKQSENEVRFCLTIARRFGHEKSSISIDHCIFSSWLYG